MLLLNELVSIRCAPEFDRRNERCVGVDFESYRPVANSVSFNEGCTYPCERIQYYLVRPAGKFADGNLR